MCYVGIIVSSIVYRRFAKGKFPHKEIFFYEEAGKKYGLTPCYFRFDDIYEERDELEAFVNGENGKFVIKKVPKPEVIHNRSFIHTIQQKRKLQGLLEQGIIIFNQYNRYPKLEIYEILNQNEELIPFLPETVKGSSSSLLKMMESHDELIIKPNKGSLGRGVVKLSWVNKERWELSYFVNKSLETERFKTIWPKKLKQLMLNPNMIVQERIPLAHSKDGVFDLRVSVQKNDQGAWQVTGIAGKVAKEGSYLTNVAQGGRCKTLELLLQDMSHLDPEQVRKDIENLSIKIAKQLECELPHLADVGLDIGITHDGFPMFIECNCRDLRYSFRNANLLNEWKKTYETPIGYASYLYKQKKGAENYEAM
ncbi:YheC/YheD family protein [Bacillus sp. FJAT-27251]|uniref:YheC/YheD family endospore coat-associated protein n=1 Tax=Bacillus sp. FJAT-27251 TaxID=1684142 RepID=UPI0006A7EA57|nr:YheC/YheD family protein [Bacillus sp. FJAT-27251]